MLMTWFCRSASQRISLSDRRFIQPSGAWFANGTKPLTSISSHYTRISATQVIQVQDLNIGQRVKKNRAIAIQAIRTASKGPINRRPSEQSSQKDEKKEFKEFKDGFDNTIKFKQKDFAETVKKFYSLYGPLFVICHIAVSLTSIGFFYSIVYFTVDPMKYVPESLITMIGNQMRSVAGESSKFVLAYAVHKLLLPFRLGGSIYLTQRLSKRVRFPWLNRSVKNDKN